MRTALTALRMGFGLALVGPAPLAGQQAVSVAIEGFNGFPWGVSRTEIEAAFGEPDQADRMDNGVLVLAFRDSLLSREAVTLYALLEGRGLVKGQHMVRIDLEAGDCEGQYRVYRDYVLSPHQAGRELRVSVQRRLLHGDRRPDGGVGDPVEGSVDRSRGDGGRRGGHGSGQADIRIRSVPRMAGPTSIRGRRL